MATFRSVVAKKILGLILVVGVGLAVLGLMRTELRLELEFQRANWSGGPAAKLSVAEAPGLRMFLQPDDPVLTREIQSTGLWQPNQTHWIARQLKPGDTFVDVGANVGYYTLLASHLVGATGRVVAFEPDPTAFAILERNVRLNGLENVTLEQKAASNEPGTVELFVDAENAGNHRIFRGEEGEGIEVEAVKLDNYFKGPGRAFDTVDFIKIDTPGAESVVLEGISRMRQKNPQLRMALELRPWALEEQGFGPAQFGIRLNLQNFVIFNMGPPRPVSKVVEIDGKSLAKVVTVESRQLTNLLLVPGYRDLMALRWERFRQRKALQEDPSDRNRERLDEAEAAYEAKKAQLSNSS